MLPFSLRLSFILTLLITCDSSISTIDDPELNRSQQKPTIEEIHNRIEYLQENIGIANDSTKQVIQEIHRISKTENYNPGILWSKYLMGRYFQLNNNLDSSLYYYLKLWPQVKNKTELYDLTHLITIGLANIYWDTGDYSNGLAFLLDAKNTFKSNGIEEEYDILNYVALFYEGILDYHSALENYKKASGIAFDKGDYGYAGIILANTGRVYYKMEQFEKALDYYKKGVNLEVKDKLYRNAGRSYSAISTVYLDLDYLDSAKIYLEKAYTFNNLAQDSSGLIRTIIADAKYQIAINQYNKSIEILKSGVPVAIRYNNKVELVEIHKLLAENYTRIGKYKESGNCYKLYMDYYQDIYNLKKIKQVSALEYKLKITGQENEINLLKIQKQKSITKLLLIIVVLSVLISFLSIVFVSYYRKNNRKLVSQNLKILQQKEILENLNKKLILTEQNANKANELKSNFLSSLSHEIRTPLNGIVGFSSLVFEDQISEVEKTEASRVIKKNSEELINTIEGLVDLSLINSNQLYIYKETFDIYEFMKKFHFDVDNIRDNLSKDYIDIQYIPFKKHSNYTMHTDAQLLKKTLIKLVHNAIKFTQKGKVEYGFSIYDSHISFFVSDTGIGIPDDSAERVFQAFIKGSNLPKSSGGLGISLNLSKKYIEFLGGKIWYESKINKGTTFNFEIPVS